MDEIDYFILNQEDLDALECSARSRSARRHSKAEKSNSNEEWDTPDIPLSCTEDGVPIRKLYIGNIPSETSESDILKLFNKYGPIENVYLKTSSVHSKKTYGFITFNNNKDAMSALSNKKKFILETNRLHFLHVSAADSWHQPTISINFFRDTISEDVVNNAVTIDCLNDDCMLYILKYLTILERIAVERVSKRWQMLCGRLCGSEKLLCLESLYKKDSTSHTFTTQKLRSLLIRCGRSLNNLDLSNYTWNLNIRAITLIAKYCPQVQYLNASGLLLTSHGIKALASSCNQLKELYLEHCPGLSDADLGLLFHKNKNLQLINLSRNSKLTGACLSRLHNNVTKLYLSLCNNLEGEHLVNSLKCLPKVQMLYLNSCVTLRNYIIRDIVNAAPQLTHLYLGNYMPLLTPDGLNNVSRLKNLVLLNLNLSSSVNDETLQLISNGCKELEILNITCCCARNVVLSQLTIVGVGALANLPKLHTLYVSYLMIKDDSLELIAAVGKLRKLECYGCPFISDRSCVALFGQCPDITNLGVSGCQLITKKTLDHAIECAKSRDESKPLYVSLGGTSVTEQDVSEALLPYQLAVDMTDYSSPHLRPDYQDDFLNINGAFVESDLEYENEYDFFFPAHYEYDDIGSDSDY